MAATALKLKELKPEELADLKWAHHHLEHPSFAARLSNFIGSPIEQGIKLLPKSWHKRVDSVVETSIRKSLDIAVGSMEHISPKTAHINFHRFMAMGSGAIGGFFGPVTLLAELPLMTMLMLRSIADIAHSEGEDLKQADAKMACVEVFALGGRTKDDEAAEAGYYGLRTVISLHFSPTLLATKDLPASIPGGVEFVRAVAARFGIAVQDKAAAKMIPIAGAISGAFLNLIFIKHFQDIARGHFIVRRLERKYGPAIIKKIYLGLTDEEINRSYSPVEGW